MQDSIRCEDTERRVERLAFLRVLGERELPILVYEVELEEDGCTSQFGKAWDPHEASATHASWSERSPGVGRR